VSTTRRRCRAQSVAAGVFSVALSLGAPLPAQNAVTSVAASAPEAASANTAQRPATSFLVGVGASHLRRFDRSTTVRVEYRHHDLLPWRVQPFVGVDAGEDRSVYAFVGLLRALPVGARLRVTPSIGAGYFTEGEFVLGFPLEFRSGVELSARLTRALAFGVAVHHVSNGGLGRLNPGSEQVVLFSSLSLR
jgi:hypothetical protein